mmetsp:Transcript_26706/g.41566  ORF Transcript_26706/g.41566 Transcript_26706/m.41566 type:complete len:126 (+) Transcript_26706:673-1050(+)
MLSTEKMVFVLQRPALSERHQGMKNEKDHEVSPIENEMQTGGHQEARVEISEQMTEERKAVVREARDEAPADREVLGTGRAIAKDTLAVHLGSAERDRHTKARDMCRLSGRVALETDHTIAHRLQ